MDTLSIRVAARFQFDSLQRRAVWRQLWERLWQRLQPRRSQTLLPLAPIRAALMPLQPRPRGVQSVAVQQIVGSAERPHDYDRQMRPLHTGLRERWIGVSVLNTTSGWSPVELIQVGNLYFIVDGHHRVSVARHNGMTTIEANVHAYLLAATFATNATLGEILDRLRPTPSTPATLSVGRAAAVCGCG